MDYANRRSNVHQVKPRQEEITFVLPHVQAAAIRQLAQQYRTSFAGMLSICLAYYFGDGKDHLKCEHCSLWKDNQCLQDLEEGTQLTINMWADHGTPLDKGTVVVGLPSVDQAKRDTATVAGKGGELNETVN